MMDPGSHNFTIWEGATFSETVEWRLSDGSVVDLNNYTGRMEIRSATDELILALTNANGGIIPLVDKRVRLFISDDDTRLMLPQACNYDLLFEDNTDGFVTAILKGKMTIKELTTKEEP